MVLDIRERRSSWRAHLLLPPSDGGAVRNWLSAAPAASSSVSPDLAAENEALKAQLATLQNVAAELPNASPGYLRAIVYSRYPFNFKNEFTVDAGASEGVATGKAVVFQGILIGIVSQTFPHASLVQTVFDPGLKCRCAWEPHGYDALLVGGASPVVASLIKTAKVGAGGCCLLPPRRDCPTGLPVAVVQDAVTSPDNLFEQASLNFAYDMNGVQTVFIAK